LFRFLLDAASSREPEGQRLCGRLSLLTFFGEAKKVSGCRAAPGMFPRSDAYNVSPAKHMKRHQGGFNNPAKPAVPIATHLQMIWSRQ
jgi:hypothetical protein